MRFFSFQGKGDVQTYSFTDVIEHLRKRISMHEENIQQRQSEDFTDGGFMVPTKLSPSLRNRLLNYDGGHSYSIDSTLPSRSNWPVLKRISSERQSLDRKKFEEMIPLVQQISEEEESASDNFVANSEIIV